MVTQYDPSVLKPGQRCNNRFKNRFVIDWQSIGNHNSNQNRKFFSDLIVIVIVIGRTPKSDYDYQIVIVIEIEKKNDNNMIYS